MDPNIVYCDTCDDNKRWCIEWDTNTPSLLSLGRFRSFFFFQETPYSLRTDHLFTLLVEFAHAIAQLLCLLRELFWESSISFRFAVTLEWIPTLEFVAGQLLDYLKVFYGTKEIFHSPLFALFFLIKSSAQQDPLAIFVVASIYNCNMTFDLYQVTKRIYFHLPACERNSQ